MFRLAVAVIEGEESRIRESLEVEEGRGRCRTQNGRKGEEREEDKRTEAAVTGLGTAEQMDSQDLWQSR